MTNIVKNISQLVESQFPQVYQEEGAELVAFIKAYYEFLETTKQSTKLSREMFDANDIDKTLDQFIVHFKEKYLKDFPFVSATDKRFLVKNILDLYSTKGSEESIKLFMRMLFNEDVDVYYPGQDIFKPSDSTWFLPKYIELSDSPRINGFVNKQITGGISGATAFVESIVKKRIDGRIIDVLYLSSIKGQFQYGEFITDDGDLTNSPRITGSMTNITIQNGGQDNSIGDIFNVESQGGRQGQVRVTALSNETGRVQFELVDGGAGYTLNSQQALDAGHENFIDISTNVYVSDRVLTYKNKKYTRQEIYNELVYIDTIYDNNQAAIASLESSATKPFAISLGEFYQGFDPSSSDKSDIYNFLTSTVFTNTAYYLGYDFGEVGDSHVPGASANLSGILDGTWDTVLKYYLIDYSFIDFEKVIQPLETIGLYSADDIKSSLKVGDFIYGYSGGGYTPNGDDQIAKGVIVKSSDNALDDLQYDIIVQPTTGTFLKQSKLQLGASDFDDDTIGENIEEESSANVSIDYITANTFSVSDTVYQYIIEYQPETASSIEVGVVYTIMSSGNTSFTTVGAADNSVGTIFTANTTFDAEGVVPGTGTVRNATTPYYISSYGEGEIVNIVGGTLVLEKVYGTFSNDMQDLYTVQSLNNDTQAWSRSYSITEQGARGKLAEVVDDNPSLIDLYVYMIFGEFTAGKEIRGDKSFIKDTLTGVVNDQGVSDVYLNNVSTANGALNVSTDTSAIGYVTGANSTSVGLHSVVGDFIASELVSNYSAYEVCYNLLRRVVGLVTPNAPGQQSLWEAIIAIEDGGYIITLMDCLDILKFALFGRTSSSSPVMGLLGYFTTKKFFIKTARSELISPPRDVNGTIIDITEQTIESVSQGQDAAFEPGSLENEENIYLYTDLIGGKNINDIFFRDIDLLGRGAGVGFLDSVDVIHYELKGFDGSAANRNMYLVETTVDVDSLFANGDGLTLNRVDGTTISNSIEVVSNSWVEYDTVLNTTETKNKMIIAVANTVATIVPCETLTGPAPDNNVTGVVKISPLENVIGKNTIIVQGDYSNVAPTSATMDTTDIGSDMYGTVVDWRDDSINSRVYIKLDGATFDSTNNFTSNGDFYAKVLLNTTDVVYLRLGVLSVVDTRVGSQVSQNVELLGGGYAGALPILPGVAQLSYTPSIGYVDDTTVTQPGSNYYVDPTIPTTYAWTLSSWTGVQGGLPLLNVNVDYGYGFGLRPHGDNKTALEDILKSGTFTIGGITSLTNINPGSLYNADPFINIINPYTAGYKRSESYIFKIELTSDVPFIVGETVTQTVANLQTNKGVVKESRSDELVMERTQFSFSLSDGVEIVGSSSSATANITSTINADTNYWGTNAVVSGGVVVATGVATGVEVISSGFGYNPDESVTMVAENANNDFVITGKSQLVNQGTGRGFWRTFNSHLNYDKKIRDNDFYQEFSYQVLSGQSLNRYEQILKDTLHVAGTKMFGGVVYESAVLGRAETEAEVDQVAMIEYQLVDENGLIVGADDNQPFLVTKEVIRDV